MTHKVLQPAEWARAKGYSNGIAARGTQVFIAGQIGWDAQQKFADEQLAPQVRTALKNVVRVLEEAGGRPVTLAAAMAKMTATESAQQVIDRALQMFGGRGVERGETVERLYREIRSLRIYEGATEVQKLIIGREVLR